MDKRLLLAVQQQITSGSITKENMDFLMGVVKTDAIALDVYLGFSFHERYVDYIYGSYKRKKLSALKKVVNYLIKTKENLENLEKIETEQIREVESTTDES